MTIQTHKKPNKPLKSRIHFGCDTWTYKIGKKIILIRPPDLMTTYKTSLDELTGDPEMGDKNEMYKSRGPWRTMEAYDDTKMLRWTGIKPHQIREFIVNSIRYDCYYDLYLYFDSSEGDDILSSNYTKDFLDLNSVAIACGGRWSDTGAQGMTSQSINFDFNGEKVMSNIGKFLKVAIRLFPGRIILAKGVKEEIELLVRQQRKDMS